MKIRLQKHLRDCLGISRRKAETLIASDFVFINNKLATLGVSIDPTIDKIVVNNNPLQKLNFNFIYLMLNKPAGYLVSRGDPSNRKTVYDLLPVKYQTLFPVGRLDYDTEGLLLLTNDGDLTYKLTHPKFEIEKEYIVIIDAPLDASQIKEIEQGINAVSISTAPCSVRANNAKTNFTLILHEGQNREIKRIFEYFDKKVLYLQRTRIGKLKLGNLALSQYQEIKPADIV